MIYWAYWERSVNNNSNNFCDVNNNGNANNNNANNSNDVRPGFCVASSRIRSERATDTEGDHVLTSNSLNSEFEDEFEHIGTTSIRRSSVRYADLLDDKAILNAFKQARRQSHYKSKVQSFDWYSMRYVYLIKQDLANKCYKPDDVVHFKINERGKVRKIEANSVRDRVVNNLIVNQVLNPLTEPLLIFDNGASRKGYGITHSRSRLEKHIRDSYLKYGDNAVIDVFDLSHYFDSIYVPYLLSMYHKIISDKDVYMLLENQIIKHNNLSPSKVHKAQISHIYDQKLSGVGIGSVISQNAGIFYPSLFDNWVTKVCGNKYYGRYMDDFYIICPSIKEARYYRDAVPKYLYETLYLTVNPKKTQTCYLTHGFKYLKNFYKINEHGKLYHRMDNDSFKRERRKIRKFKNTKMTDADILQSYKAWRGNVQTNKYNMPRLQRTDEVFKECYPFLYKKLELKG